MDSTRPKMTRGISYNDDIAENTSHLHREYGDEMYVYNNADIISRHHVRTETEDTKRHKTPQRTGSECVRNRNFRTATVCLGLLCVLLLTAVIVLCVQLFRKTDQFNKERDQIQNKTTVLQNETNELLIKNNNLIKQSEQCSRDNTGIYKLLNDGWICYKFSFYYISSEIKSWNESRNNCKERGADLVIINNREEQDFVRKITNDNIWIGLTDSEKEGTWIWVDGSTLTSGFWMVGQPNSYAGEEDCALSMSSGWNDYPCGTAFKWVCEKSIVQKPMFVV
ncbi:CD209 antigen-like protein E isoform X6 [Xyrauchen texanus]|uniref:CD209 antigen-like protein E isoform X6 n=1 Tax=Xyrauchen texanus TaxID=154827 RepID=UPI0022420284|nr:CD209 antigen-like protein E isoform X6 [Xyrauchen texanus]